MPGNQDNKGPGARAARLAGPSAARWAKMALRDCSCARIGREVGASTSYGWARELASVPRTSSCMHHRKCALFRSMLNLGSFVAIGFPVSCLRPRACTNPWVSTRSNVLDLSICTLGVCSVWLLIQAWMCTNSCLH